MTNEIRYINTLEITKNMLRNNIGEVIREMRKHDRKLYDALCGEIENLMIKALGAIDSIRYIIEARDC